MDKGNVTIDNDTIIFKYKPRCLPNELTYKVKSFNPNAQPTRFFTATTDMKDFIGNVVRKESDDTYLVKGVYRGRQREVKAKNICSFELKNDERVMITEHVDIDGNFGFILTKHRILDGDLNFINIGWTTNDCCKCVRICVYTGECKEIETIGVP